MKDRIVKEWTDHYYHDPITGMIHYRPKVSDNLIKKKLKCTMYRSGDTIEEDRFMAIHEGKGGPIATIAIGDTIEECESKFNAMLKMSLAVMGLNRLQRKHIESIVSDYILQFPHYFTEYKNGRIGLLGLYVGHVMKTLKGKGDPYMVNETVVNFLKSY